MAEISYVPLHVAECLERRVVELEAERDQARDLCKDYEAYLDDALAALGVKTVFDIPVALKGDEAK